MKLLLKILPESLTFGLMTFGVQAFISACRYAANDGKIPFAVKWAETWWNFTLPIAAFVLACMLIANLYGVRDKWMRELQEKERKALREKEAEAWRVERLLREEGLHLES